MLNQQIIEYIESELVHHTPEAEIKKSLQEAGWTDPDIEANLAEAKSRLTIGHAVVSHETPEKRKFMMKHAKSVVALVVSALLLSGGAFAAYKFVAQSPQKIVQAASMNLRNAKSFDFSGKITADVTSEGDLFSSDSLLSFFNKNGNSDDRVAGSSNVQFGIDFSGTVDMTNSENPKSNINMKFNASIFTLGLDLKIIDSNLFFKLDQVPPLVEGVEKYAGVWIKVDPASLSKDLGLDINLQNGQASLTEGQKKQIEDLLSQAHLFSSIEKLASDTIDNQAMHHYSLTIDKQGFKNYLNEVERIITSAGGFTGSSSVMVDDMEFSNLEVWIGKSDKMVHRIAGDFSKKPTNEFLPASGTAHFLFDFKNFDRPSTVEIPTEFEDVQKVIQEVSANVAVSNRDAIRVADMRQIQTALELYYNENSRYPRSLENLRPDFLQRIPIAPTPVDGSCTEQNNTYVYTQRSTGRDYTLTFCLGQNSGGFDSGLRTVSSAGIE